MSEKPEVEKKSDQPKRHLFQYRRKESRAGRRDPMYNPERDLAHIGPNLVRGAMMSLDEQWWEPWLKEFMEQNHITCDTIVETEAPLKMAKALNQVIRVADPVQAMQSSGFADLPYPIQMLFYCRMGQCFLAAVWSGVKDVGSPEDKPPASFQDLLDDTNAAFQRMMAGSDAVDEERDANVHSDGTED